ncbi:MAG: tRNA glutamyl-Q(34) synthetase GluQRS [Rhodothalassiaceae bacterium]
MPFVTRFAPSPTGRLHLGHAFSALLAHDAARAAGGRFLLRIEDIDRIRCREEHVAALLEDLDWLGIAYERPVRRQSEHMADYAAALDRLGRMGVLYPCICTRREIALEVARAPSAPHGPEGALYPGTCRRRSRKAIEAAINAGRPYALRLDVARANEVLDGAPLRFEDDEHGSVIARPEDLGDVVLGRKDFPASYHLAVVHDDALQGITHVIRGEDLFHATHVHRLLQALLGLPVPHYRHHRLLADASGRRLAKRDGAETLAVLRARGMTSADIRRQLGL